MSEAIEVTTSALDASPSSIQWVWRQRKNPLNAMDHPSKQVKEKLALNDRKHKSNVQPNPTEIVKPERGIASFLSQITTEIGISKQINPQFRLKGGSIVIQSDRGRM